MTDAVMVSDVLRQWIANARAAGTPAMLVDRLLVGVMAQAGARCAALFRVEGDDACPLRIASCGDGLPDELACAIVARDERPGGRSPAGGEWMDPRGSDDDTRWLVHRAGAGHGARVVAVLGLPPGGDCALVAVMLDWLLVLAAVAPAAAHTRLTDSAAPRSDADREDIHRVNNALGAIAMHADLGTLLTEGQEDTRRLHRLFREIGARTAICATAVRTLLRRE